MVRVEPFQSFRRLLITLIKLRKDSALGSDEALILTRLRAIFLVKMVRVILEKAR